MKKQAAIVSIDRVVSALGAGWYEYDLSIVRGRPYTLEVLYAYTSTGEPTTIMLRCIAEGATRQTPRRSPCWDQLERIARAAVSRDAAARRRCGECDACQEFMVHWQTAPDCIAA